MRAVSRMLCAAVRMTRMDTLVHHDLTWRRCRLGEAGVSSTRGSPFGCVCPLMGEIWLVGVPRGPIFRSSGVSGWRALGVVVVGERLLLTPAQAAEVLQVRESWLRRRAAERRVPCCFVGKHLRFSRADLEAIAADGARPARAAEPRHRRPPRDHGWSGSSDGRV
jgi:excisionase family DNA binding protein